MDDVERMIAESPERLNFFAEGAVVGRVGMHVLSKHCASTPKLQVLELRGSNIGHMGANMLAKGLELHPCLTQLGIARNGIDTPALSTLLHALRASPLRFLDLEWNGVDNAGAAAVASFLANDECELRTLSLERNDIRPSGAIALAKALAGNTTLRNLNLGFNRIGNAGASAIAEALCGTDANHSLLTLNLTQNDITTDGGRALGAMLCFNRGLHSVNLQGNQVVAALVENRDDITLSPTLRELNLHSNRLPTSTVGEDLGHVLQASHKLKALSLANSQAGDSAMAPVLSGTSFMANLSTLDVSRCGLGRACFPLLGDVLSSCPSLHTLVADHNNLGPQGGLALAQGLRRAASLTYLSMAECDLRPNGVDAIAAAFAVRTGLPIRELYFADNAMDTDSAAALCTSLVKHSGSLEAFDLSRNRISVRICPTLLTLLDANPVTLKTIAIRDNPVGDLLRENYMHRAALLAFLQGPDAGLAATAGPGDAPSAPSSRSNKRPTPQGELTIDTATGRDDPAPMLGAGVVSPSSVHYPLGTVFDARDAVVSPGKLNGGRLPGLPEPVLTSVSGRAATAGAADTHSPGARGSRQLVAAPTAAASPSRLRAPPVVRDEQERSGAKGLSALSPVPFGERRVQLHDVESNMAGLCISDNQLRLQFNLWDTSGDGTLSADEFTEHYLKQLAVVLPSDEKRVKELVDRYCNDDGRICFDEFCIMMLKLASA